MTKIESISTEIVDLPTIRGHVLSMTTMVVQSIVLVRVRFSDGSVGLGEGTSIGGLSYGSESPESIKAAIDTYIAPMLEGCDADNINHARTLIEKAVRGNPIARCAVEIALWDGLGKRLGVPVAALLGGAINTGMDVAWTLASGNSDQDIAEAEEMLARRRHRQFKLKIGKREVRDDIAHVARICSAVGDRATITVDVNQAWDMHDARWGLAGLQEIGVAMVEQPIDARMRDQLKALTDGYEIAVMADEALQGPVDALQHACDRGVDAFAVKIAQSGGLKRASEVISIAEAAGLGIYGGTCSRPGSAPPRRSSCSRPSPGCVGAPNSLARCCSRTRSSSPRCATRTSRFTCLRVRASASRSTRTRSPTTAATASSRSASRQPTAEGPAPRGPQVQEEEEPC